MASRVDALADAYTRHVGLPWDRGLAPPQRVWFAVYPKDEERRLRYKVEAFQLATTDPKGAGKKWVLVDLTDSFARWLDDCDDYPCPGESALDDLRVVEAMQLAATSGRTQHVRRPGT